MQDSFGQQEEDIFGEGELTEEEVNIGICQLGGETTKNVGRLQQLNLNNRLGSAVLRFITSDSMRLFPVQDGFLCVRLESLSKQHYLHQLLRQRQLESLSKQQQNINSNISCQRIWLQLLDHNSKQKWVTSFHVKSINIVNNIDMVHMAMVDHNIFVYIDAADDKIVVFDVKKKLIWNVENEEGRNKWDVNKYYQIVCFSQSKIICVVQSQHYQKISQYYTRQMSHQLRKFSNLYYYRYDPKDTNQCEYGQFIILSQFGMQINANPTKICKLDNYSKMGWLTKDQQKFIWVFHCVSITKKDKISLMQFEVIDEVRTNKEKLVSLNLLWEIETNKFLCYQQRLSQGFSHYRLQQKNNYPLILTVDIQTKTGNLSEVSFRKDSPQNNSQQDQSNKQQQYIFPALSIHSKTINGNFMYLILWDHCQEYANCIYETLQCANKQWWGINNAPQSIKIIALDFTKNIILSASQYLLKYDKAIQYIPRIQLGKGNVQNVLLMTTKYQDQQTMQIQFQTIVTSMNQIKDCYMQMLLHLYQDFDDDLLHDAMQLLLQHL